MSTNSLMRESDVRYIVLHCSATRCNTDYTEEMLLRDHLARKFKGIGYHFYIRKDGRRVQGRKLLEVGAHAVPYNRCSIGVCYEGGLDANGLPKDTRTLRQKGALLALLRELKKSYPRAFILGHHDLNPQKECPCFNAASEYSSI